MSSAAPRSGPACPPSSASWPRSRCSRFSGAPCVTPNGSSVMTRLSRALTRWRLWLYDCLSPRVPAALAGWRSGDLLARAIDDVDALQDLYLRTLLPVAVATGAAAIGTVAVGLILPWAALALGLPLLVALDGARAPHLAPQRRRRSGCARRLSLGAGRRCPGRGARAPRLRRRGAPRRRGRGTRPPFRRARRVVRRALRPARACSFSSASASP